MEKKLYMMPSFEVVKIEGEELIMSPLTGNGGSGTGPVMAPRRIQTVRHIPHVAHPNF